LNHPVPHDAPEREPAVDDARRPGPELLAPAGGREALLAAVANGADAVYLGLGTLNARRSAENFTPETLAESCRHAHLAGARVYLTANTLVLPHEMADALELIATAWEAGVDAAIVQDLGLMRLVAEHLPEVRLHASTQVNAHNSATLDVLQQLGCKRVTLAREVSLTDITRFCARPHGPEIEVFVHGSLCYCFSGQCLMSSMIGGRSANRGTCAQPCRMPYQLVGDDGREVPVDGDYLLSPRDLAGIELLPDLVRAGVASLKIEGRMKAPEYVALVTGVYRAALDRAIADPDGFRVTEGETAVLEEAFSRGFTDGYLTGEVGPGMMSYRRPNNRGVPVGRVTGVTEERDVIVALDRALSSEDTIEFWTRAGRFAQPVGRMESEGYAVARADAGARVLVRTIKPVRAGDRIFRVADADLLAGARRTWARGEQREVPVDLTAVIVVGRPLEIAASAAGFSARVSGPVVEAARTRPLTAADVAEHLGGRLGGSGYVAGDLDLELDPAAGLSFSLLHRLRREVVAALDQERLAPWADRTTTVPDVSVLSPVPSTPRRVDGAAPELVVWVADPDRRSETLEAGASAVLVDWSGFASGASPVEDVLVPRIVTDSEAGLATRRASGLRRVVTGNLGLLAQFAAVGIPAVEADSGLNAVNPWTVEVLSHLGATATWLSPELSESQVRAVARASASATAVMAFGRTELMVAENCVLAAQGPCDRKCGPCARRRTDWVLRDRKGYEFPTLTDVSGRSHIFNAVTLDLSKALPQIIEAGVGIVGIDARLLTAGEARRVVSAFRDRLDRAVAGLDVPQEPLISPATAGHFFRGVE
jgi:putative protease